jgi:membrane fusion protein, multidrug efflux system
VGKSLCLRGFVANFNVKTIKNNRKMYKWILFPVLLLIAACGKKEATPAVSNATTDDRIVVKTAPVTQKTLAIPVHGSGMLTSTAEQRLSFKIGGVIRKIYVDEGDQVRAGQLLAILDKTEIDAQVAQANQGLSKSERDLSRVENLYRDSSATLELVQNATTGRDLAKETVRIAQFNQQYAEIRATRSGRIIKKLMNEGEVTGPGMPVFVLFESGADDWVVRVNVSDRDWARLAVGMSANVKMDAYPDTKFTGRISELAPAADPANGLYPIEVRVAPQGKKFAPGLFAEVDITPSQSGSYSMVPVEAIIEGNGREAFVFAVGSDGESVQKQPVRVAFLEGRMAVLQAGLTGVTEVVTTGAPYLTDQKKIRKVQ